MRVSPFSDLSGSKWSVLGHEYSLQFRIRQTLLKLLENVLLLNNITAIMTLQQKRVLAFNIELGFYRFVAVAYTCRIRAFNNVLNEAW